MDINAISTQIDLDIQGVHSSEGLEEFRLKYLGRKGVIAELTSTIPSLSKDERAAFGQQVNSLKNRLLALVEDKQKTLSVQSENTTYTSFDIGMPGIAQGLGHLHPVTQITDEICSIFSRLGFSIVDGPEIETEYNNFTGLNIPLEHPSREAFDTFYLKDYAKLLLRSHTSPVQVRAMQERKPPLAIVVPGRVYRPDAVDASHSFMFHQIEGFMVDAGIKFSDLKGVLEKFAKAIFGNTINMRFRPHFFPFTEPSAEVDISCIICKGKGCSVCGRKGWLEILGSGMIHPHVFKHVGIDAKKYTGFAFGLGVERIAMLKYGINDIRLFFENDLRFLKQF
ncbi:MAG: phenylalanine--tRNA ligase subunit alpha [Candidatus Omnitrophica bacterium]|nr:phenylalanine--tRNA ligase subunit alpha [Candidatus Omnitrophota bacterium]